MSVRPTLDLVSAANARFFPGLLVALASAVSRASGRYDYAVHVLDGGLHSTQWESLQSRLKRVARSAGIEVAVKRILLDAETLAELPLRRGSPLTFARLILPRLLPRKRLVYLDSDVLCLAGIEPFWEALDDGTAVTAVVDPLGTFGGDKTARRLVSRSLRGLPYFNAGIIGMNSELWASEPFKTRINELFSDMQDFRFMDQTLLNLVFRDSWREVPGRLNLVLTLHACGLIGEEKAPANYHFVGPRKPWLQEPAPIQRLVPNALFDRAWQWIEGADTGDAFSRSVDQRSVATARRKAALYRCFRPSRVRDYSRALHARGNAKAIAREIWNRFGLEPLEQPAAKVEG